MNDYTFLFADLSGFTALTEAHGDLDAAITAMRFYDLARIVCGPRVCLVKTMGDAVMLVCRDPEVAAESALRLLEAVNEEKAYPAARAGLHCGPAVERDGDYFGATVNVAARTVDQASPGEVLGTAAIAQALSPSPGICLEDLGATVLRNVAEPVSLYRLRRAAPIAQDRLTDPVCRMQLRPGEAQSYLTLGDRVFGFCSPDCAAAFARAPERFDRESTPQANRG